MKKPLFLALIAVGAVSTGAVRADDDSIDSRLAHGKIYLGAAFTPLHISGLETIDASDWQNFGTGPSEGRIRLPLDDGNTNGVRFGGRVGYEVDLGWGFPVLAELSFFPGKLTAGAFVVGINYQPIKSDSWSLGISPKIGYIFGSLDFGTVQVLPGKTPPVITPTGTFNEGDALSASISGVLLQVGVNADFKLADKFGLRVEAGFQYAILGTLKVKAGDVELNSSDPALVKSDGTTTPANINPSASSIGPFALVALTYHL